MRKIGINAELGFDFTTEEMIKKIKAVGFDAIFTGWGKGAPISEWKALADSLGLEYTFIHAPFGGNEINNMWLPGMSYLNIFNGMKKAISIKLMAWYFVGY